MKRTNKPTIASILAIIIGVVFGLLMGTILLVGEQQAFFGGMALVFGIIAIIGGVYTLRRRFFFLAATGSYSALLCGTMSAMGGIASDSPFVTTEHYFMLVIIILLGILAIVLTHLGKGEFG